VGAYNLHRALASQPLDFFVMFSSVASVLGSAGQAHYAAANSFLDSLAHWRKARGLPAQSLNWGAWGEVGLATRADRAAHLAYQGLTALSPPDGAEIFARLLASPEAQIAPIPVDFAQWRQSNPKLAALRFLEQLGSTSSGAQAAAATMFSTLQATPARDREHVLKEYLRASIGKVARIPVADIHESRALRDLGIDSLMMVTLKNTLQRDLGLSISTAMLYGHPSVDALTRRILDKLKFDGDGEPAPAKAAAPEAPLASRANPEAADADDGDAEAALRAKLLELGEGDER
jgi:aryl carrier-like protein